MGRVIRDARFDFRGGLNLSFSPDVLDKTELQRAQNIALTKYGALRTRPGTQRVHVSAIGGGATVLGLFQWHPSTGRELVAIANTNLYHKTESDSEFTEVVGSFSASVRPDFAQHIIAGTPSLFIADGTLRKWDGGSISAVSGAPNATRIRVYKTRLFAVDDTKTLYWSRVSNPEDWSASFSGSSPVETYDAEGIVALEVIGSSLLIIKENSIARFTGVSSDNIRIDQETEGISPDIGTIAPNTVLRVEEFVFLLSDRGPYAATEAGVQALGRKVEPAFDDAEMDHLANAVAVHHKARREIWVFFPENTETENTVGYCFNYRVGAWTGPWEFSSQFNVASAALYERDDTTESLVLGGYDGLVREGAVESVGGLDDVLRDGSGGSNIRFQATLPDLIFGSPGMKKRMSRTQWLSADLGADGELVVETAGDGAAADTSTITSKGAGNESYDFRPGTDGRRIVMTLTEDTDNIVQINGLDILAESAGVYV